MRRSQDVSGRKLMQPLTITSRKINANRALQYCFSIVTALISLLLVSLLWKWIQPHPTPIFLASIAVTAWLAGLGPSIVNILLSTFLIDYFFIPPTRGLELTIDNIVRAIVFVIVALVIYAIDSARKRAIDHSERLLILEREARKEAEQANRSKDEFIAMVAHELRTPLGVILGWSHMLLKNSTDGEKLESGLKAIERNARTQKRLLEDLMDVSRIVTGNLHFEVGDVNIAQVVRGTMNLVQLSAEAKGIQLLLTFDSDPGIIKGDSSRIQQIIWNLLTNAVKFTPEGGEIKVHVTCVDSSVCIKVQDTGIGISEEFLPYVFDRFKQGGESHIRQKGLGLGLSIVRQLTEMHGGRVTAESNGKGQGSTFTLYLPMSESTHSR
jgi:signal transduction histidine kinase